MPWFGSEAYVGRLHNWIVAPISTSYSIGTLWLPMFIAWLAKILTLRYGGMKMYRTAMDFFIGLLLGDFIVGCLWPIVGWIIHVPTYSFMQ